MPEGEAEIKNNIYIIDSSSLIDIFRHYDPSTFEGLWKDIDKLIKAGRLISHMEVYGELSKGKSNPDVSWLKVNKNLFEDHTVRQTEIIRDLQKKFRGKTNYQKVLVAPEKADYHADPWLIALITELQEAKTQQRILMRKLKNKYFIVTEDNVITTFATNELGLNCINKNELFKQEGWKY